MGNSLDIEPLGLCIKCGCWLLLKKDWLPEHKGPDGERCPNSGYSRDAFKYHIKTYEGAVTMAKLIANDHDRCLNGGGMHSLNCGDGDDCARRRLIRAKALADYVLAHKS